MTGRGAGFCAGADRSQLVNQRLGFGFGGGRGLGRGFQAGGRGRRNRYYATGLPGWARGYGGAINPNVVPPATAASRSEGHNEDLNYLKQRARYLRRELEDIESRVKALQQNSNETDRA
jgi:hypothetical protein